MAHVKGMLRVGAYLGVLTLAFGALQVRAARAEVRDRTVELGRQMARLANASEHDVNRVTLNGQAMWLGSSLSRDPVSTVLDRYEAFCDDNRSQPAEEWRRLAEAGKAQLAASPRSHILPNGVLRAGTDREGTVTCFTRTEGSKPTLGAAIEGFARTGNLGELGAARYVYAKVTEKGNTLVLTGWTDDTFNIPRLVGEEGKETPGEDFSELPRPRESTRVFSARVEGTPFGVNVYRSGEAPSSVARFYDEELGRKGWLAFDADLAKQAKAGAPPQVGRLYEKDGVVLTLYTRLEEDHRTFTGLGLAGVDARVGSGGTPDPNDPTGGRAGTTGAKPLVSESRASETPAP